MTMCTGYAHKSLRPQRANVDFWQQERKRLSLELEKHLQNNPVTDTTTNTTTTSGSAQPTFEPRLVLFSCAWRSRIRAALKQSANAQLYHQLGMCKLRLWRARGTLAALYQQNVSAAATQQQATSAESANHD